MIYYYIIDLLDDDLKTTITTDKNEFLESLKYNHEVATENGDDFEAVNEIIDQLEKDNNYYIEINAFGYGKTNDLEELQAYLI